MIQDPTSQTQQQISCGRLRIGKGLALLFAGELRGLLFQLGGATLKLLGEAAKLSLGPEERARLHRCIHCSVACKQWIEHCRVERSP